MSCLRRIFIEPLESRTLLTGVTLITHGFGGSAADWVTAMGHQIASMTGPLASQPIYEMTATDPGHDGGPISITTTRLGPAPANWGSSEIIILLDWSDMAGSLFGGYSRPTADVGTAVANQFLQPFSIPDLATPLAQLPIDLIGHSRGASLISEMARVLGEHGVWVDQATYLDPHPVDGINDPLNLNFGDAAMKVYDNVQYADDFWRTDGGTSLDFTGEAVNGAYNLQLNESVLESAGYSQFPVGQIAHSDVHLWYNGTIGAPFVDTDGSATIGATYYSTTTTPPMGPRDQIGWRGSRIANGTRFAAGLKSSGAHRDAVTLSVSGANLWDNVQITNMLSNLTLTSGTSIGVNVNIEDKTAAQGGARDATFTIGLDRDDNPYNGVFSAVSTPTTSLADSFSTSIATANISGAYRVYAKISNGVNTRYYYAPGKAIIAAAGFTKTWVGPPTGGTWSASTNWTSSGTPAASDKVSIFASDVTLDATTTTKVAQLDLQGGASFNLHDHNLVIDWTGSSPIATVRSQIIAGRSSTPAGIYSDLTNGSVGFKTLGYAESSDVLHLSGSQTASFASATVDATSVLIRYTYAGDADLNGTVNGDDYFRLDAGFAHGSGFSNGDFDYNGKINADDYFLADANYARHGATLSTQSVAPATSAPLAIDPATRKRRSEMLASESDRTFLSSITI